jgi:hypothetical protein
MTKEKEIDYSKINEYIEYWHENKTNLELYEFLELTEEEYASWVKDAALIENIIRNKKIKKIIKDDLSTCQLVQFINIINKYKSGAWLYPGVFKRYLNININQIINLLDKLITINILNKYYETFCIYCYTKGSIYINPSEIDIICQHCENETEIISLYKFL